MMEDALTVEGRGGALVMLVAAIDRVEHETSEALLREIEARATTEELKGHVEHGRRLAASLRRFPL